MASCGIWEGSTIWASMTCLITGMLRLESHRGPATAKFRVGLLHGASGVNAGAADFENYRIVIEDSSGDLLGYQAETVSAGRNLWEQQDSV